MATVGALAMPTKQYKHGISSVLRNMGLPAGRRYDYLRKKSKWFIDAVIKDVEESHGELSTRHATLIHQALTNYLICLLVDNALRRDPRLQLENGDLDMLHDGTARLLELKRKASGSMSAAMSALAVPVSGRSRSEWDEFVARLADLAAEPSPVEVEVEALAEK